MERNSIKGGYYYKTNYDYRIERKSRAWRQYDSENIIICNIINYAGMGSKPGKVLDIFSR